MKQIYKPEENDLSNNEKNQNREGLFSFKHETLVSNRQNSKLLKLAAIEVVYFPLQRAKRSGGGFSALPFLCVEHAAAMKGVHEQAVTATPYCP